MTECKHSNLRKDGKTSKGWQRYKCRDCGKRPTIERRTTARIDSKRLVITSAQNDTPVHKGFWAALQHYAAHRDAQLLVIPTRYRNPDAFSEGADGDMTWPIETLPHLIDKDVALNKHLILMGDAKINATTCDPLSGMDSLGNSRSAIYGHAQVQMRLVATPRNHLPRILHTTGSCSLPNYSRSKAGKQALFHHSTAALVVEIVGERFHMRELIAVADGSFQDLDCRYSAAGVETGCRVAALVLGDEHVAFIDKKVSRATAQMVERLRPQYLVRHDMHDHYSQSHHHQSDTLLRVKKAHKRTDNVEAELMLLRDHIVRTTPVDCVSAIVSSNHHDHLRQWVNRYSAQSDPANALFAWELLGRLAQAIRSGEDSDPFRVWLRSALPAETRERVVFLDPNEPFLIAGIDVSQHGDKGPNGSRGGLAAFARLTHKMFLGHSHTPGIRHGAWQVGVSAPDMDYASGLSSWLATHGVIYPSGKRAMLHVIAGRWHG